MQKPPSVRNLVIFGAVTLACGWLGAALNRLAQPADAMQSPGVLLWLVAPLGANLLLRWLGRDGWRDFGFAPHLLSGWRAYLAALLLVPAVTLVLAGGAALTRALSFSAGAETSAFLSLLAAGIAASLMKNIFEEFAWRGYLTPRLEALQAGPWSGALVTGLIWAGWHIPYYLFFLDPGTLKAQTALSALALSALAFVALPLQAFAFAELRLWSRSVWPGWLLHTLANAFTYALVTGGFALSNGSPLHILLTPTTEGLGFSLLLALAGWGLRRIRLGAGKTI